MTNYIKYKDSVVFHPGYYIEELVEESGLTQQDFANRLGTTPKTLSKLINGRQGLSAEIALKLSNMLGTSLEYWQNLQNAYDAAVVRIENEALMEEEIAVLKKLDYSYFRDNFQLPDIPRKLDEQVFQVRRFLGVASLTVLCKPDLSVSFRSAVDEMSEATLVKTNALIQIAMNETLKVDSPKFDKKKFNAAIEYALTQTTNHDGFYPLVKSKFLEAGVILVILPNLKGSNINGASKKIGSSVMLMVNDRRLYADTFWFTLLHEAGHIANGDLGASLESDENNKEAIADKFAEDLLIPSEAYQDFVSLWRFDSASIKSFAKKINRDPGIVLGRLQNDGYIGYKNSSYAGLRCKYKISYDL